MDPNNPGQDPQPKISADVSRAKRMLADWSKESDDIPPGFRISPKDGATVDYSLWVPGLGYCLLSGPEMTRSVVRWLVMNAPDSNPRVSATAIKIILEGLIEPTETDEWNKNRDEFMFEGSAYKVDFRKPETWGAEGVAQPEEKISQRLPFTKDQYLAARSDNRPQAIEAEWFNGVLGAAEIDAFRMFFGQAIMGNPLNLILCLVGTGGSGKSTLLGWLEQTPGQLITSAPASIFLEKSASGHPTGFTELKGARIVVADEEVSANRTLATATLKTLTGGRDRNKNVRGMHQDHYKMPIGNMIVFEANVLPRFSGGIDTGLRRRLIVIPFLKQLKTKKAPPMMSKADMSQMMAGWVSLAQDRWEAIDSSSNWPLITIDSTRVEEFTEKLLEPDKMLDSLWPDILDKNHASRPLFQVKEILQDKHMMIASRDRIRASAERSGLGIKEPEPRRGKVEEVFRTGGLMDQTRPKSAEF